MVFSKSHDTGALVSDLALSRHNVELSQSELNFSSERIWSRAGLCCHTEGGWVRAWIIVLNKGSIGRSRDSRIGGLGVVDKLHIDSIRVNLLVIAGITCLYTEFSTSCVILDWAKWIKRLIFVVWCVLQVTTERVANQRPSHNRELLMSELLSALVKSVVEIVEWRILNSHEVCIDARIVKGDLEFLRDGNWCIVLLVDGASRCSHLDNQSLAKRRQTGIVVNLKLSANSRDGSLSILQRGYYV